MSRRGAPRGPVAATPDQRREAAPAERVRVVVRGPSDPAQADELRRAIVRDLATLAVELLADGKLPPPSLIRSAS